MVDGPPDAEPEYRAKMSRSLKVLIVAAVALGVGLGLCGLGSGSGETSGFASPISILGAIVFLGGACLHRGDLALILTPIVHWVGTRYEKR